MLYKEGIYCTSIYLSFDRLLDDYNSIKLNLKEELSEITKCKIVENVLYTTGSEEFILNAIVYKDNTIEILGDFSSKIIKSLFDYVISESFKLSSIFFLEDVKNCYFADLSGMYRRRIKECKFKVNVLYTNNMIDTDFLEKYKEFSSI